MQNQSDNPANAHTSTNGTVDVDAGLSLLTTEALKVLAGLSGLALLEVKLAAQSIPKYLTTLFVRILLLICIWVSLSACLMWSVYILTNSVFTGLIVMTVQQIIGFIVCNSIRAMYLTLVIKFNNLEIKSMTLSKTIYLQNKRLELSKASFKLAWQRQTVRQQWTAGLMVLFLGGTAFFLARKTGNPLFNGIIHNLFSVLLVAIRTQNLLQPLQTSLKSHSRQEPPDI
jgi:hypothetical protein